MLSERARALYEQVREDDLTVLVAEAASFVEKERARASKRARRHREGRPRSVLMPSPHVCCGSSMNMLKIGHILQAMPVTFPFHTAQGCGT